MTMTTTPVKPSIEVGTELTGAKSTSTLLPPPTTNVTDNTTNQSSPTKIQVEDVTNEAAMNEEKSNGSSPTEYELLVARSNMDEKLAHGRAFLKSGATDKAVDLLALALEEFVGKYGEFSLHCALVYRSYGAALLQHYQANSSVLGDVIGNDEEKKKKVLGEPADDDEEDEDAEMAAAQPDNEDLTLSYEVLETARVIYARHYSGPGKIEEAKAPEPEEEQKEQQPAAAAAATSSSSSTSSSNVTDEKKEQDAPSTSGPIDTSVPALTQREIGLALAYTYEILASFFMEKEDFGAAYADYAKALALTEPHVPSYARDLAGLHMDLAVCALFDSKPEQALESYKAANAVLKQTCAHLEEQIKQEKINPTPIAVKSTESTVVAASTTTDATTATPAAPETNLSKYEKELSECVDIMDELKERIEDITAQLALPVEDQPLALIKQQNLSGASPFSTTDGTSAAAASSTTFAPANPFNPFAMPSTSTPSTTSQSPAAAAAATSTVAHAPQVKRKVKPVAPTTTDSTTTAAAVPVATSASPVDRSLDADGSAAKRLKTE